MQRVETRDLGTFDQAFRELSPFMHPGVDGWREMGVSGLRTIAALARGPSLLQLAMCHPSGYVREEAIRRCATCSDGAEIGFLVLRTNDWVHPVRVLAESAFRARLTIEHVPDLIAALPLLDAMPSLEPTFWFGRYVERAESTARMLDAELPRAQVWRPVVVVSGEETSFASGSRVATIKPRCGAMARSCSGSWCGTRTMACP